MTRCPICFVDERPLHTLGALPLPNISAFTRVFDALWGEGWGEGVTGQPQRPEPLTPPLSQREREQTERAARPAAKSPLLGAIASFFLLLVALLPALALDFPALSGRVVDEAGILDPTTRTALTDKLAALEAKTTDQLVVVTLKSLQGTSIEDYGYQLGRRWQIGQKDKNNGVLLIVVPSERKLRIDVGYGLEGTLTDAISRVIISSSITPRFRANDYPGGISRGVDDIISVLTGDAEEWKRRAAKRPDVTTNWVPIAILLLALGTFVLVFIMIVGSMPGGPTGRRRARQRSAWSTGYGPSWSAGTSSGGGFSDGGFSAGGSSGDSGFSGGGGSFGGGGASGSW
jgi:uncharacterized protein